LLGKVEDAEAIGLLKNPADRPYLTRPLLYLLSHNTSPVSVKRFSLSLARQAARRGEPPNELIAARMYLRSENLEEGYDTVWNTAGHLITGNQYPVALDLLSALEKLCRLRNTVEKLKVVLMKKADIEKTTGNTVAAEKTYQSIIELYRDSTPDKLLGETYKDLGDLYKIKQNFQDGIDALHKAEKIYTGLNDQLELSRTLNNIGNIYYISNQWDPALAYYRKALKMERSLGAISDIAVTLSNIGVIFTRQARLERAIRLFTLSLNMHKELKNPEEIARALNNRGYVYRESGKFNKSVQDLQESLRIQRRLNQRQEILKNLENLSQVMILAGHPREALEFIREGRKLAKEADYVNSIGIFASLLAAAQKRMGFYGKAKENAARAIDIGSRMEDKTDLTVWMINMSDLYLKLNQRENARQAIEEAITLANKTENKKFLLTAYSIKGLIENDMRMLEKAEEIASGIKSACDVNLVRLNKACLFTIQKDFVSAAELLNGLSFAFTEENPDIENAAYFNLNGVCALAVNEIETAKSFFDKGYRIANSSALLPEIIEAAYNLGKIYAMRENYESAYNFYRQAIIGLKTMADDIKDEIWRKSFLSDGRITLLAEEVKRLSSFLSNK
ncbi:MAG: tetratricopeptide repeat protein, partial [candidate division Zixibacteria bacterium]|nr:tetratricopeptide repeat protein [candidate division Zixibacteria bacterium]